MFLRRMDMFGSPVITSIKKMARKFNKSELPSIIISLYKTYGKNNIKDIKGAEKRFSSFFNRMEVFFWIAFLY